MSTKKSFWERIDETPASFFQLSTWVIVIVVLLFPIGIPISVTSETDNFYDAFESLPEGSRILVNIGTGLGSWATQRPLISAVYTHMIDTGLKPIFWSWSPEGPLLVAKIMEELNLETTYGIEYGKDWVLFGYIAGEEAAFRAMASDFRGTFPLDYYGNKIDDLPIMDSIETASDFASITFDHGSNLNADAWHVRQLNIPYGLKIVGLVTGPQVAGILPYYPEIFVGYLGAAGQSAAEYEMLIGKPGRGMSWTDCNSILTIGIFIILIVTNIIEQYRGGNKNGKY